MAIITYYEVYLFRAGDWQLHGRYPSDQKKDALMDAKQSEEINKIPTKIIKETYNTSTNATDEAVIYISEKIRSGRYSGRSQRSGTGATYWDSDFSTGDDVSPALRKAKFSAAIVKLSGVVLLSMVLSALLAFLLTFLYSHANGLGGVSTEENSKILFGTFLASFVVLTPPLSMNYVPWQDLETPRPKKRKRKRKRFETDDDFDEQDQEDDDGLFTKVVAKLFGVSSIFEDKKENKEEESKEEANEQEKSQEEDEKEEKSFIESFSLEEDDDDEELDEDDYEENQAHEESGLTKEKRKKRKNKETKEPKEDLEKEEMASKEDDEDDEDDEEDDDEEFVEDLYKQDDKNRKILMKFLSGMVSKIKSQYEYIDAFGKFGINLMLAGACSALKYYRKIPEKNYKKLIKEAVELMGTNPHLAEAFIDRISEYMLEPKYTAMIEIGHDSMEKMINSGEQSDYKGILNALDKWNEPKRQEQKEQDKMKSGIVAVMFTDMVDSTYSTQNLGDKGAQEIIRIHNKIVRDALNSYGGIEIKHTGDGIMASFGSTSQAVEGAVAIQKHIEEHNKEKPNAPLQLRIGINAGEPIVEEDDLFGTTVQLASRVCNEAHEGEIFVSNVVKELSAGKTYQFYNLGAKSLKGISEPQVLHEVIWEDRENLEELSEELSDELSMVEDELSEQNEESDEEKAEEPKELRDFEKADVFEVLDDNKEKNN